MFIIGIITSIFWAIVIAAVLWILCAFSGRLINSGFRMSTLQHVLCFVVAVPTFVLLITIFMCNKINRLVTKADNTIAKVMMADKRFVEQLNQIIASNNNPEAVADYISESYAKNITSEYPILEKYIDMGNLTENLNIGDFSQGSALTVVQSISEKLTAGIRSKIKSVRRKTLIAVVLLQAIAFGVVFYQASNYRSPAQSNYFFESDNYL